MTLPYTLYSLSTFLTYLVVHSGATTQYNGTLELVHLMYRHGDRAPINLYANDPHKDPSLWPNGLSQLTERGKARHYALGKWLRNRYRGFVNEKWIAQEVYVRSTDVDRTLMSAAVNLAAFYKLNDPKDFFEKDLPWSPAPIHTAPLSTDHLLDVDESCPRITEELDKQNDLPAVKKVIDANKDLFHYVSQMSGDNISTIVSADYLYDTLYIESLYNLTLPNWTHGVLHHLKLVSDFSFQIVAMSKELKRLRASPIIKEIGEHMQQKVQGKLSQQKMYVYSAHDTTIAILLVGLGVFNNVAPPYATTVIIELHKIGKERFVKMLLRNDTNIIEPPHELVLPGCTALCPLDDWLVITGTIIPKDWESECKSLKHGASFTMSQAMLTGSGIG
ncbi:prostatic acid phosphatase isoform X2 [Cherax quadricarinatus]|uniref:prostatic acid phosphatase isoform X2 n=1 Tax=Cherax quadricarinatus TaxID=27406 RepID=UPI00387EA8F5